MRRWTAWVIIGQSNGLVHVRRQAISEPMVTDCKFYPHPNPNPTPTHKVGKGTLVVIFFQDLVVYFEWRYLNNQNHAKSLLLFRNLKEDICQHCICWWLSVVMRLDVCRHGIVKFPIDIHGVGTWRIQILLLASNTKHYIDVIMSLIASQITSLAIVY